MQLLINHLTRMQPGWICAAGIDLASGRHIRPVAGHGLPNTLLDRHGGPLSLGVVAELGPTEFCGAVPEIEDRQFDVDNLRVTRYCSERDLHSACQNCAEPTLRDIFGEDLEWLYHEHSGKSVGFGTAAIEQHCGIRSLGCYWAESAQLLVIEKEGRRRVRMRFREGELFFEVPVTDYRYYMADQTTPDEQRVAAVATRMASQTKTLVAVGLSRAYRNLETQPARHWLQVNNIFV